MSITFAEYIWIDGTKPTALLRSKTKAIPTGEDVITKLEQLPEWGFDGSSTNQAAGDKSDCALKPVFVCEDPIRGTPHVLVLCEVYNADDTPHVSNTRAHLRELVGNHEDRANCWFGLEQEYTLFKGRTPLGFPQGGYPAPQGPYYCGVGADEVSGRPLVEAHMMACANAGLKISGVNAEVMPGQWEFQIGPATTLEAGDHLWVARWILYRLGEDYGINASLDPKPVRGDWNGAGCHTNFSTPLMREQPGEAGQDKGDTLRGMEAINAWCETASNHVKGHLATYGPGLESRLTGLHETARFDEFTWGESDRTASIRIPLETTRKGYGYLEDRRPNANIDPYEVAGVCLKTAYGLWDAPADNGVDIKPTASRLPGDELHAK
jgi:glutamine synthetase